MSIAKLSRLGLIVAALPAVALADLSFYIGAGAGGSRVERDDINLDFKVVSTSVTNQALPPYSPADGPPPYAADPFISVRDPQGTDLAWKVFAGVRYGSYLGLEAGFIDLGETEDSFGFVIPSIFRPNASGQIIPDAIRPVQDRQIDVRTDIDGWQLSAVAFLPLGERFELFGKVGGLRWERETRVSDWVLARQAVRQPGAPDVLLYTGGRDPLDPTQPAEPFALSGPDQNLYTCLPSPITDGAGGSQPRTLDAECTALLPRPRDSGTDLALGFGLQIKASERVSLRAEFEWFDIKGTDLTWVGTMSLVFGF